MNWTKDWEKRHPNYNLVLKNCQTFALDLARWLCPGRTIIVLPESLKLRAGPAKLKVGPNLDTGAGLWGGQAFLKVLGFGASVGGNGIGIHTPIGSLCLVRCS